MRDKRFRLDRALYIGLRRHFLTFCTADRRRCFADAIIVGVVREEILQCAALFDFAVIAYCFMPDHLHLLIEGETDGSDALAFIHQAKQRSGYELVRRGLGRLWQPSFYDRILRDDEATLPVVRYILENPVRAGLVVSPEAYRFSGTSRHEIDEVLEAACWEPRKENMRWLQ
jgi:putative transposase